VLELAKAKRWFRPAAMAGSQLAYLSHLRGDSLVAYEGALIALEYARRSEDDMVISRAGSVAVLASLSVHAIEPALQLMDEAMAAAERARDHVGLQNAHVTRGDLCLRRKQFDDALSHLEIAESVMHEQWDAYRQLRIDLNRALLMANYAQWATRNNHPGAVQIVSDAHDVALSTVQSAASLGKLRQQYRAERCLAQVLALRGEYARANALAETALEGATRIGDKLCEVEALFVLGKAKVGLGQVDDGLSMLRRAAEAADLGGYHRFAAESFLELAEVLQSRRESARASAAIAEAYAINDRLRASEEATREQASVVRARVSLWADQLSAS
jgi:tetratricopeptide (TPR) repeat protein